MFFCVCPWVIYLEHFYMHKQLFPKYVENSTFNSRLRRVSCFWYHHYFYHPITQTRNHFVTFCNHNLSFYVVRSFLLLLRQYHQHNLNYLYCSPTAINCTFSIDLFICSPHGENKSGDFLTLFCIHCNVPKWLIILIAAACCQCTSACY